MGRRWPFLLFVFASGLLSRRRRRSTRRTSFPSSRRSCSSGRSRFAPASARRMTMRARSRRRRSASTTRDSPIFTLRLDRSGAIVSPGAAARSEPRARARRLELRLHRAEQAGRGAAGDRDARRRWPRRPPITSGGTSRRARCRWRRKTRRAIRRGSRRIARRSTRRSPRFPTTSSCC